MRLEKNPTQNELGKMPLLLLGNGSLRDMKDYNNHAIQKTTGKF